MQLPVKVVAKPSMSIIKRSQKKSIWKRHLIHGAVPVSWLGAYTAKYFEGKKTSQVFAASTIFSAAAGLFIFTLQGRVSATKLGLWRRPVWNSTFRRLRLDALSQGPRRLQVCATNWQQQCYPCWFSHRPYTQRVLLKTGLLFLSIWSKACCSKQATHWVFMNFNWNLESGWILAYMMCLHVEKKPGLKMVSPLSP